MPREYGVAVVGCGVGKMHVEAWQALPGRFAMRAVADLDGELAKKVAADLEVPDAASDMTPLLQRSDIDVIDISTPPATHLPLAEQALAAGKHVVLEKPLVGSLADVDRLARAAKAAKGRLMPIFQYRFSPGILKLKRLVDAGVTGKLFLSTVETAWKRGAAYYSVPWRGKWASELGGCFTAHAIHAHDMLCWIAGPIASVYARTATRVNPIEVEDTAVASFVMQDGSLASTAVTLGSAVEISRLRFCFANLTAESALSPYNPGTEPWTFAGMTPEDDARIAATLADFTPGPERFTGQFERFHAALETGGPLPVTLDDGRASIELLTALYHSSRTGRPVELPISAGHPAYDGWRPELAQTAAD
jgi:predicted dehydrogenase